MNWADILFRPGDTMDLLVLSNTKFAAKSLHHNTFRKQVYISKKKKQFRVNNA